MRFFKYLFIIALFIGITLPSLTSCSDDEDSTPLQGYWYADLQTDLEMVVFKNGKFATVLPPRRSNLTLVQMKEWVDEALNTHKVKDFGYDSNECVGYGTYTFSGNKLVLKNFELDEDDYEEEYINEAKVSFNGNTMVITWDKDEYTVYQRYTGK